MGPAMRVLSRVVREFATGVDAGNAVRLGLPVRADAPRDSPRGAVRDASAVEADATTVASRRSRTATSRARA